MGALAVLLAVALAQQTPVPQPFPSPGSSRPAQPPPSAPRPPATPPTARPADPGAVAAPAKPVDPAAAPDEATLGVNLYPGAQFIASYDAGRGQRFYLFGTTASFTTLVTYYRTLLRQRGDLIFEAPATHQFDIGRFREETMAFPPSVTIKDFESAISQGYPNPKAGGQPARFPTIIQIVPATEK
jgi:hypothetical protein